MKTIFLFIHFLFNHTSRNSFYLSRILSEIFKLQFTSLKMKHQQPQPPQRPPPPPLQPPPPQQQRDPQPTHTLPTTILEMNTQPSCRLRGGSRRGTELKSPRYCPELFLHLVQFRSLYLSPTTTHSKYNFHLFKLQNHADTSFAKTPISLSITENTYLNILYKFN